MRKVAGKFLLYCLLIDAAAAIFAPEIRAQRGPELLTGSDPSAPVIPVPTPRTLGPNCTARLANQTVQVNPDGSDLIPNVPIFLNGPGGPPALVQVQYLCTQSDGTFNSGTSEFFTVQSNAIYTTQQLNLQTPQFPVSLTVTAPQLALAPGATTQLEVTALLPDGTVLPNFNSHTVGTFYRTSNASIATVGRDGLVTAGSPGIVNIFAINSGAVAGMILTVNSSAVSGTGTVTGHVTLATGAPAASIPMQITGTGLTTVTDKNGNYTVTTVPVGVTFSVQALNATSPVELLSTSGQILTVNLAQPPLGTVVVKVLKADGTPYAGVGITESDSGHTVPVFAGVCDSTGTLTISNIVMGTFGVMALDATLPITPGGGSEGQFVGSAGGVIPSPGASVNVTINAPILGTIQGTIYAGDGQTPLSEAGVTLADGFVFGAIGELQTILADTNGHYQFSNYRTGAQGFKIIGGYNDINASSPGILTSTGQTVTVNVTLPLQVVKGAVTFSDGTPVSTPNVFASNVSCCGNSQFSTARFVSNPTDASGNYTIFLPSPLSVAGFVAPYYFTAQDAESQLQAAELVSVTDPSTVQTLNVTLPASGTVTGTITINGTSTPYQNAVVDISDSNLFADRQMQTGTDGVYSFDHVPLGQFVIQASNTFLNAFSSAGGVLAADGATVTVNLSQNISPNAGSVSGTIFAADGVTPVANALVTLENLDSAGPISHFQNGVLANASGFYQTAGSFPVPLGNIRVSASSPSNAHLGGLGTGVVTAGNNTTVNVTLGNAIEFAPQYNLAGSDGFQYAVDCDGSLVAQPTGGVYTGAGGYQLSINGHIDFFPCLRAGSLEAGGRQVVLGPATLGNVSVTRKVFSPSTGGFARYLEYLTNPGTNPVTVRLEVDPSAASRAGTIVVIPPSFTNNTYAVTDNLGNTELACVVQVGSIVCALPLGFVFGGPNASLGITNVTFLSGLNTLDYGAIAGAGLLDSALSIPNLISYVWDVTLPAGGTAILMHFLVLRGLFDDVGAQAEAQALVGLTDPNALVGMTATDKANVVNFNLH